MTVKPIELCRWLASILSPPPEYAPRRLLIPFSGSGSEMIGAILSGGFEEIVGIELEAKHCAIARPRLEWWAERAESGASASKILKKKEPPPPENGQMSIFDDLPENKNDGTLDD